MSSSKKDLTRIEDLGEFLHEEELNSEENSFEENSFEESSLDHDESSPFEDFSENQETSFEESSPWEKGETEEAFESEFQNQLQDGTENNFQSELQNDFQSESDSEDVFQNNFQVEYHDHAGDDSLPAYSDEQNSPESMLEGDSTKENHDKEISTFFEKDVFTHEFETPPPIDSLNLSHSPRSPNNNDIKDDDAPLRENFDELKQFSENSTLLSQPVECNPSFSIAIHDIKYIEDAEDILILLKELNLLWDEEKKIEERLQKGHLLIPRISEFSSIFLLHKLRRFDITLKCGPSDLLSSSADEKSEEAGRGVVSKENILQNKTHHFTFTSPSFQVEDIVLSTSSQLDGFNIVHYLGIATEYDIISTHIIEQGPSEKVQMYYQDLSEKLKVHASQNHANAILGIHYQLSIIPHSQDFYRLTCSGTMVQVEKYDTEN